jgi:hypothetical protein
MKTTTLGKSPLKVSRLCLGTMMFGDQTPLEDARSIVADAQEKGCNFIDTADVYTLGKSEEIVGEVLKGQRHRWVLASKVGNAMSSLPNESRYSRSWMLRACEDSLRRLDTDHLDIYYLHRDYNGMNLEEPLRGIEALLRDGKIRSCFSMTEPGAGADPTLLLDGTTWGGFEVVLDAADQVDTSLDTDPVRCMIPEAEVPFSISPAQGWVATANNDPGGHGLDSALENSRRYIGGPWDTGTRMRRIADRLDGISGAASLADMMDIQADHSSPHCRLINDQIVNAVQRAEGLAAVDRVLTEEEQRLVDAFAPDAERLLEAAARLEAWEDRGCVAASGVETFYDSPTAQDVDDSVAAMIFNETKGWLVAYVLDDEAINDLYRTGRTSGRINLLHRMLTDRGPSSEGAMASWDPSTRESAFWDVLGTPEVERADELLVLSLRAGLDALSGPPTSDGAGGFGTSDMAEWRWGLRHMARFESVLAELPRACDREALASSALAVAAMSSLCTRTSSPSHSPMRVSNCAICCFTSFCSLPAAEMRASAVTRSALSLEIFSSLLLTALAALSDRDCASWSFVVTVSFSV